LKWPRYQQTEMLKISFPVSLPARRVLRPVVFGSGA